MHLREYKDYYCNAFTLNKINRFRLISRMKYKYSFLHCYGILIENKKNLNM